MAMTIHQRLLPFAEIPESFKGLKDDGIYYVDKTGFIPYLISQRRRICVFTRPRRFGKTLMLRTLQTFFEYALDDEGNPIDNRHYFEGLEVMSAGDDVLKHMGQYPVISLSFKDVWGGTYEKVVEQMRGAVCNACIPLEAMIKKSGALCPNQLGKFQSYLDRTATEAELRQFLSVMMEWLNKVTKRQTVVLLDEYDVPLQKAVIHDMKNPDSPIFDDVVTLVGCFISAGFKSNDSLAFGIISGCVRVAKESVFTGMNNPGVITVTSIIPDEYWGFTQKEVEKMLDYYNLSSEMEGLKHWYDGYYYSNREVYNPWSLLNAIRGLVNGEGQSAIQSYWARTSSNDIIDNVITNDPDQRNTLARIMDGDPIWAPLYCDLSYRDLNVKSDAIWSFLLYTGYLKSIEIRQTNLYNLEALMTIPNIEIRSVMNQAMQHWWKDIKIPSFDAHRFINSLLTQNIKVAERELRVLLNESTSVFDYNEAFYHGMLVGLLKTGAIVRSNDGYGEGRPDIVAIVGDAAIIIEVKCVTPKALDQAKKSHRDVDEVDLVDMLCQSKIEEATRQIQSRKYQRSVSFHEPLASDATAYAICFCKKWCTMVEVKNS